LAQQKIFAKGNEDLSAKEYADAEVNYRQSQAQLAKMQKASYKATTILQTKPIS
jgi:hypothetical protein